MHYGPRSGESSVVTFEIYMEFFDDYHQLPDGAKKSFQELCDVLYRNPYDPDLISACQTDDNERFAYSLGSDCAVYWRVEVDSTVTTLEGMKVWFLGFKFPDQ